MLKLDLLILRQDASVRGQGHEARKRRGDKRKGETRRDESKRKSARWRSRTLEIAKR